MSVVIGRTALGIASILLAVMLLPGLVQAQIGQAGAARVTVATAPRLQFTPAEMALARAVAGDPALAAFYGEAGLRPVFTGAEGAARRQALLTAIAEAPRHGIPSARYAPESLVKSGSEGLAAELAHTRALSQLLRDLSHGVLDPGRVDPEIKRTREDADLVGRIADFATAQDPLAVLRAAAPDHPAYIALQKALSGAATPSVPAHLPRIPDGVWRIGDRGDGLVPMRARLSAMGYDVSSSDPELYDIQLAQAVQQFQTAAGLGADGIAGPQTIRMLNGDGAAGQDGRQRAIAVAMERLRWMNGHDLMQRHVWVNIPEFATTIVENGSEVFRTRSVVGENNAELRTPEFSDMLSHVVVNPTWTVPPGMLRRIYLPGLQANRHAYPHLDVIDRRGNVVPREALDLSSGAFPYRLRQKPSDANALGIVKFIFPNPWNIYLHDTPNKGQFGNRVRAASNGCIRIGDPIDLAHQLLSRQTDNPAAMFRRARDSGRETWLTMRPAIPVHLVYFTAWPDADGRIRIFDDVYGRDARIWRAFEAEVSAGQG
ncbi:MAG: L,D-transpeptidase family protein [Paracoccus sp. (in: a-proteobacteria)]|nr:L,D-transpeptidase family protein [Paracoccus sp. (in: a-proteobacteria)]